MGGGGGGMACLGLNSTTRALIKTLTKSKTQNKQLVWATLTSRALFSVKANILDSYACKHLAFSETSHHKTQFKVSWFLLVG